jgi:hypothetical protein
MTIHVGCKVMLKADAELSAANPGISSMNEATGTLYRVPEKHGNFIRFEVFTVVTMKNVVFWDIKPQFVLHRRHIISPLQSPAS